MPTKRIKVISTVEIYYKGDWTPEELDEVALGSVFISEAVSYSGRTYRVKNAGQGIDRDANAHE